MAEPDDRLRYALPDEQHERIFQQDVLASRLPASTPVASPVAVILGGQPGAGKTALLAAARLELQAGGSTVTINGDTLRSFHPQYRALQEAVPLDAARYTDHDSGRWVEKLIAAAQERRINLVIESTMRLLEVFVRTAGHLHEAGYQVEARVLAISKRLSWQGVHQRYEAILSAGDAGRFSAQRTHDAGASGMLETLRQIERTKSADRVLVADRAGMVLYDNELVNGDWRDPPTGVDVVLSERLRSRNPAELQTIERGWNDVIDSMQLRQAPATEVARVRDLAAVDMQFFRARTPLVASSSQPSPSDPPSAAAAVQNTSGKDTLGTLMCALRPPAPSTPLPPDLTGPPLAERLRGLEERAARSKQGRTPPGEEGPEQEPALGKPKPRSGPEPG